MLLTPRAGRRAGIPLVWCLAFVPLAGAATPDHSVARLWNEQLLAAIRRDTPRPTVHARNLHHVSGAMYDAWAAYTPDSAGFAYDGVATGDAAAREAAVSYAAYRVLRHRFATSLGAGVTLPALDAQMAALGLNVGDTTTVGTSAAAIGNRVAAAYLARGLADGSNEAGGYADTSGYTPANVPLVVSSRGTTMSDPARWQPLTLTNAAGATVTQRFLTPHWGGVSTFALPRHVSGGMYGGELTGVSPPPAFGTSAFARDALEVVRYSAMLDPADGVTRDISPGVRGNSTLGTDDGTGHALNPVTGLAYAPNVVRRGDFGRVLAEFWADGPRTSTPPGHWNEIANDVSNHPLLVRRVGGTGPEVDRLEWDVKLYFALNGSLHDAAVASWDAKREVDYARPISMIRELAGRGQSSDPSQPRYDPTGLPLEPGLSEVVTAESVASGRHAGLSPGDIAIIAWRGHDDGPGGVGGVGWIDAETWMPYQARDFVTPAFAGYTSGHSTFSRAAAEVLAGFTGDAFFPGGLGEFAVRAGTGLNVDAGPDGEVTLQWATYFDAADEAGISRLSGGIHVRADDYNGRMIGGYVGRNGLAFASRYFDNTIPEPATGLACVGVVGLLLRRVRG